MARKQQVPKSDENKSGSSSSGSTGSEEMAQIRWAEVVEKFKDIKGKGPLGLDLDYNSVMDAWPSKKGIVIGKSQTEAAVKHKASETKATVEPKAKRGRSRRSFAVNSNYYLRSKGMVVDVSSETNAYRKRKKKKGETDDYQGPVTDSEEVCKKTKKEPNNGDDGTDDDDGTVGGAHTNVPSVGTEVAAGN